MKPWQRFFNMSSNCNVVFWASAECAPSFTLSIKYFPFNIFTRSGYIQAVAGAQAVAGLPAVAGVPTVAWVPGKSSSFCGVLAVAGVPTVAYVPSKRSAVKFRSYCCLRPWQASRMFAGVPSVAGIPTVTYVPGEHPSLLLGFLL